MIKASYANSKTIKVIEDVASPEMISIEEKIMKAINGGNFSISGNGYLQPETKILLETLGYKIEIGYEYNDGYYIVSWN